MDNRFLFTGIDHMILVQAFTCLGRKKLVVLLGMGSRPFRPFFMVELSWFSAKIGWWSKRGDQETVMK
jgi:hypothetical protein